MDGQAAASGQFLMHVETRRSSLLAGVGLGLVLGLLALLSVEGAWRGLLVAAALVAGPALSPLWAPVETLWLKGDTLTLTDEDSQVINIWLLSDRTEALRKAVGERVRFAVANTDLWPCDPKTRRLLVMDTE